VSHLEKKQYTSTFHFFADVAHRFYLLMEILLVCTPEYLLLAIPMVSALQCSSNSALDHSSLPLVDRDPVGMNSNMYLI